MASLKTLRLKKLENLNAIEEIVEGRTYYVESNNTLYRDIISTRVAVGKVYFAPKGISEIEEGKRALTLSNALMISNEKDVNSDEPSYKIGMYDENGEYIDLSIGTLIENISLDDDNNLVLTFKNGTTTSVPLNNLLTGVVKSINGKNPDSSGVVSLSYNDLEGLLELYDKDEIDQIKDDIMDHVNTRDDELTGDIDNIKLKDIDQDNRLDIIESDIEDIEEDLNSIETKLFNRVRIFNEQDELITIQMIHEGENLKEENKLKNGYLFDYGTRNLFDYNTIITEDLDLVYSIIPPRYIQTTTADFNRNGDYIGTEEYIILPEDKPNGYRIQNINVKGVATSGDYLTDASDMFRGNNSLYLELDYLNTRSVTNMRYMFNSSQATTLDLSSFDTSNVIDMFSMFRNSQATTLNVSGFDTSNVTDMYYMFYLSQATALDLSSFDTSNITDMSNMFYGSQATTLNLTSFDTSNVTNMSSMFTNSQATTLDLTSFDTSNVTNMIQMFQDSQATTLDLSSFNTSNVTNMYYMFYGSQATTLDLSSFDTSNVTNMNQMFRNSQAITGYARTEVDADKLNSNLEGTYGLNFVVKGDITNMIKIDGETITRNTNQELEVNLKYIMDGGDL